MMVCLGLGLAAAATALGDSGAPLAALPTDEPLCVVSGFVCIDDAECTVGAGPTEDVIVYFVCGENNFTCLASAPLAGGLICVCVVGLDLEPDCEDFLTGSDCYASVGVVSSNPGVGIVCQIIFPGLRTSTIPIAGVPAAGVPALSPWSLT